jgi:CheY-like chemotaxis protein
MATTTMLLKDRHIFIVEDNPQNRVVFQLALIRHGAQVAFDRWGRDAVFRLRGTHRYDLIILDLMLVGGISGFDLHDEIRAMPEYAAVPIVAVSAMEPAVALPKARAQGFAGFIAKPIDVQHFPRQLASIIEGQPIWDAGHNRS